MGDRLIQGNSKNVNVLTTKWGIDLYKEIPKMSIFWLQNGGVLYTGSTYRRQNTVNLYEQRLRFSLLVQMGYNNLGMWDTEGLN